MKLTAQDWGKIIGCKCGFTTTRNGGGKVHSGKIVGVNTFGESTQIILELEMTRNRCEHNVDSLMTTLKPILRTFDQMTEEEETEHWGLWANDDCDHVDYLDSIHIDQRGWIKAGLAIKEGKEC